MQGERVKKLAERAFYSIRAESWYWKNDKGLNICVQDKQDCISEACLKIVSILRYKPDVSEGYLVVSAKRCILSFLFGSHKVLKRGQSKGLLYLKSGLLNSLVATGREKSEDTFVDRNLAAIYELLLSLRKKKGERGLLAASRDAQILRLLSLGWGNKQIGLELGISEESVKTYRKLIRKSLQTVGG